MQLTIDLDAQRIAEESLAAGDGRCARADRPRPRELLRRQGRRGRGARRPHRRGRGAGVDAHASTPTTSSAATTDRVLRRPNGPPADRPRAQPVRARVHVQVDLGDRDAAERRSATAERGRTTTTVASSSGTTRKRATRGKVELGTVDLPRALTVSSDVYFYTAGNEFWNVYRRRGRRRRRPSHPMGYGIQDVARQFGFGAPTGIELPGDQPGRIPTCAFRKEFNKDSPDPIDDRPGGAATAPTSRSGQGDVLVTPLQLANALRHLRQRRHAATTPQLVDGDPRAAPGCPRASSGTARPTRSCPPSPRNTGLDPEVREPVARRARRRGQRRRRHRVRRRSATTRACTWWARPAPRRPAGQAGHVVVRRHHQPDERSGAPAVRGRRRWWSRAGSAPTSPRRSSAASSTSSTATRRPRRRERRRRRPRTRRAD